MKRIMVLCPTRRDNFELSRLQVSQGFQIIAHPYKGKELLDRALVGDVVRHEDFAQLLDHMVRFCDTHKIDGVFSSSDYPGSILASIIAHEKKLIGASPAAVLRCQHKYYARRAQKEIVPEATPDFLILDPMLIDRPSCPLTFPIFVKPVKSYFSAYAQRIDNWAQLERAVQNDSMPERFCEPFNWLLKRFCPVEVPGNLFMAETYLEGMQCTLEGFVHHNEVELIGIVDSQMYPGTMSFSGFTYPTVLPPDVQTRMGNIAKRFINGVFLDNTFFNIEFMYNPAQDTIHIIEVNTRMASQFADLYEKVDGTNTYSQALRLAVGERPSFLKRMGDHKVAASFALRVFQDQEVIKVPTQEEINEIYRRIPDARAYVCAQEGMKLSQILQDGQSFLYAHIHLGGRDAQELQEKLEECRALLPFEMVVA